MNITTRLIALLLIISLASCSSTRVKEKINYQSQGEQAQKEYEKFELSRLGAGRGSFESEGVFTSFKISEFEKTIEEVSPETINQLPDLKKKETIAWGIYAFWLASIFIKDKDGNRIESLYYGGAFAYLGYLFVIVAPEQTRLRDQFNRDLKSKISPKISFNLKF